MNATSEAAKVEDLFRRYAPKVQRFMERHVGDPEIARDLAQETFVRACRTSDRFDGRTPGWPWLNTIVRCVLYDETVRPRKTRLIEIPLANTSEAELARALPSTDPAMLAEFDDVMTDLTSKERKALILHHMLGLDRHEVAQEAGLSTKGADTLMMRAKRALQSTLLEQAGFSVIDSERDAGTSKRERTPRRRSPKTWSTAPHRAGG